MFVERTSSIIREFSMTANREDEHNSEAEVGDGFCLMLPCNERHYRSQMITDVTRGLSSAYQSLVDEHNVHAESSYWIMGCGNLFLNHICTNPNYRRTACAH